MIRLPEAERQRLRQIEADKKAILRPHKEEARKARKASGQQRQRSIGKAAQGQRQARERDPGFLAYLRRQPCEAAHLGGCNGPIEAAHIRFSDAARGAVNPGMQRKNHDRFAAPLCHFHHQHDQHRRSERAFWASLGKDAYATAERHFAAYKGKA